jgi:hypothetical protein
MSFDRYKDKTKHGASYAPDATQTGAAQNDAAATDSAAADATHDLTGATSPAPPAIPVVAAPTRPIVPPVMPGINKGYNIQAQSTTDDAQPAAQITHMDTKPTVHLAEKSWQKVTDIGKRKTSDDPDDRTPLDVRMSYLPNAKVAPVSSPENKLDHGRTALQIAAIKGPAAEAPAPKPAAELASCAAVDAYKKKQLEAIQGDRQTLAALQSAIAELGLGKQLDFMTGAKGNISAQNTAMNTAISLDSGAPSLARPVKN